jgi:hypothetical protein
MRNVVPASSWNNTVRPDVNGGEPRWNDAGYPGVITVRREKVQDLRVHAMIRNAFETTSAFDVVHAQNGFELSERALAVPFRKDYDGINTNVPACRLYAAAGFILSEANFGAYPGFPNEVQLIWRKRIASFILHLAK